MQSPANDAPPAPTGENNGEWPVHSDIEPHESRNLLLLAAHQIVLRTGWIFKTESVIMPAFLDAVAGAGWLRGCLPILNRFGQSVPPVFCAGWLRTMRYKKRALAACVVLMSFPFALLAAICWYAGTPRFSWMPGIFLTLYGLFFVFNGLYHLSFGTVQGKLIRPTRRGRLLLVSTFWGSLPAMFFAWWLLPGWLEPPDAVRFDCIFLFTAVCFFLSGLTALLLFEPADDAAVGTSTSPGGNLHETWLALRHDGNLRLLVIVAMLFGCGLIIFPHYQALARERLGLSGRHLMFWVITQNAAIGVYSLFVGPLADRWGNRLTLRTLIFGSAIAPLFAVGLTHLGDGLGEKLFWLVFIPLGMTPLVLRIMVNYALEICEPHQHPRYLSTVSLCLAVPFVFSPAVGWLVDVVGFQLVFLATAGLIALGGSMTFRLDEPRHRMEEEEIGPVDVGVGGEE